MALTFADLKQEWRHFRADEPGSRFANHRKRMEHKSRGHAAVTITLGVLLFLVGVVFLFIPGPGLPFVVFGFALIGTHSKRISERLDRAEPRAREIGQTLKEWWSRTPRVGKAALALAGMLLTAAFMLAGYQWILRRWL
jgi:hypothetical protein